MSPTPDPPPRWYQQRTLQLLACCAGAVALGLLVPYRDGEPAAAGMTAVTFLMAVLWIFEILRIPVAAPS